MVKIWLILTILTLATYSAMGAEESVELHPIFSEPEMMSRAPASAWPEEFVDDFAVMEPSNRGPASTGKHAARLKGKNGPTKSQVATGRRSRLPSSVSDGFEIRVKSAELITTFWVVKRGEKFDLLYSNSADSKSSVSLSPESFHYLHEAATRIPASDIDVNRCADNSMQIHVVAGGHAERTSTFCLNSKTKAAEQLRVLGNALVVRVR